MAGLDIFLSISKFLYFVLLFLSAGGVLFYVLFEEKVNDSKQALKSFLKITIRITLIYAVVFQFFEAMKFMGSSEGLLDIEIQKIVFQSHLGVSKFVAIMGLVALYLCLSFKRVAKSMVGVIGVTLIAVSFSYTGHTADNPLRLILAPLLILHILIILYWFGSLIPLYLVAKHETPTVAGELVEDYSRKATFLVPLIFITGLVLGVIIMNGFNFFNHTYGMILLFKVGLFSSLMLIAALNKWHLGPDLLNNRVNAARNFKRALIVEWGLIALIILATAILTGYYSPGIEG